MTWSDRAGGGEKAGGGDGLAPLRVMTDEQIEVLRHQIAQYTVICEELVEMHRVHTAQHGYLAGPLIGPMYCDPMTVPRITARQRWTPTPSQLQILERLFDQGIGTPSKAKIKELAEELSEHGPISEANVYNWFQNRRARSKRKQQTNGVPNNSESEAETDFESPDEKKAKLEKVHPHDKRSHSAGHLTFRSSETSPEASSSNQDTEKTQGTRNLMGEMRVPESYMTLHQKKCFYMAG